MSRVLKSSVVMAACAALFTASPVFGWAGVADNFQYSNGGDINGKFGTPFVFGDTLFFTGVNFDTDAANGATDTDADTMSVDIQVDPGLHLSLINVSLAGAYALQGEGSQVDLQADYSVTELGGLGRTFNIPLVTTPVSFPLVQGPGANLSGNYTADGTADVSFAIPSPDDNLQIVLDTVLEAVAAVAGNAGIDAKFADIALEFVIIPEPSTMALFAIGGLALIRRRRSA